MVICNDFELQLVSAENKTPFKEHEKGGKTYVEVEPDTEYFLSLRKVRASQNRLKCTFKVDGKSLGYSKNFGLQSSMVLIHTGVVSRSNGVRRNKALKFVTATFTSEDTGIGSTMAGMGKIELQVYNAIDRGRSRRQDMKNSFKASSINMNDSASLTMKKNLRSGEGYIEETSTYDSNATIKQYSKGDHLYTITLYYCATPGLIAVGVLPKPPMWEWHRKYNPAKTTAKEKEKLSKAVLSVKRNRKGNEILELADSDDESVNDSDNKNDIHPDRALSTHKKAKL